ncbi:hypothetical protein SRABI106_02742 [Rahnella aquatilis]|nr:hypothetical protein SRABI106_02742 [Rahnella aquatilis]
MGQNVEAALGHFIFQFHQLFNLHQEPAVHVGQVEDAVNRHPGTEGISDIPDTLGTGFFQFTTNFGQRFRIIQTHFRVETARADFQAAQGFLQRFLLCTTNRHHFADRFHLRGQTVVGTGKFLEVEARNFSHNVVDRRFKRRWRFAAGDIVHQLIEGVTHRQFRRHFSNRETGRFGGQG